MRPTKKLILPADRQYRLAQLNRSLLAISDKSKKIPKNYPPPLAGWRASLYYVSNTKPERDLAVHIHITASDGVPIYLQVVNQIKYLVAAGRLVSGEELPPIRTLAEKLVVNPNTIARAYRELEMAGIVEKRRTAGTYVSDQGSPLARRERMKILTDRIDQLLAEAGHMDVSLDEVLKLIQQRYSVIHTSRQKDVNDV